MLWHSCMVPWLEPGPHSHGQAGALPSELALWPPDVLSSCVYVPISYLPVSWACNKSKSRWIGEYFCSSLSQF